MPAPSTILDLGHQPLANAYADTAEQSVALPRYPLKVVRDGDVLHLTEAVPPEILYTGYPYRSGVSAPFRDHCAHLAQYASRFNPRSVMDIGGNDGTMLTHFRGERWNVEACADFKDENECKAINFIHGTWPCVAPHVDMIISTNVFQHTEGYLAFIDAVAHTLNDNGVWILEFPWMANTVMSGQYDQVYHEHYYYWNLTPLRRVAGYYGLRIIDAQGFAIHGGSMRIVFQKSKGDHHPATEMFAGHEKLADYAGWQAVTRAKIIGQRQALKQMRGTVAGFGAAAKGTVFLNAVGSDAFRCVVDDTKTKQGKFMPGTPVPIISMDDFMADPTDNVVVLAHNFYDAIETRLRTAGYKGAVWNLMTA